MRGKDLQDSCVGRDGVLCDLRTKRTMAVIIITHTEYVSPPQQKLLLVVVVANFRCKDGNGCLAYNLSSSSTTTASFPPLFAQGLVVKIDKVFRL